MFNHFMRLALEEAKKAYFLDEVPVGAVVVEREKQRIVSACHNSMYLKKNAIAHAEILAINMACELLQVSRLEGCDIYVTLEPCPMCATAISLARLKTLYFGAYDPKAGGVDHGPRVYSKSSCHHIPEYYGGICEKESAILLKRFFMHKR